MGFVTDEPFDYMDLFTQPSQPSQIGIILTLMGYAFVAGAFCWFELSLLWLLKTWIHAADKSMSPRSSKQGLTAVKIMRFLFPIWKVIEIISICLAITVNFGAFFGYWFAISMNGLTETLLIGVFIWLVLAIRNASTVVIPYKSNSIMIMMVIVYGVIVVSYVYGIFINAVWLIKALRYQSNLNNFPGNFTFQAGI